MINSCTRGLFAVILCGATAMAQPPGGGGGLLDGLNGEKGKAPPRDRLPPDRRPPTETPPADARPAGTPSPVDQEIEKTRAALQALRNTAAADIAPFPDVESARRVLERQRKLLSDLGPDIDEADRKEAAELQAVEQAFHARFDEHREAIEANRRPAGITPLQWATMCDEYYRTRSTMTVRMVALQQRLERRKEEGGRRTDAHARLAAAEETLRGLEARGGPPGPEVVARLHEARIAIVEQRLRTLEQIKTEQGGQESGRANISTRNAWRRTGDWYIDTMDWLARAMATSNRAGPPADASATPGLPAPRGVDGVPVLSDADRQKARIRWRSRQIDLLSQSIQNAPEDVAQEDQYQLEEYERSLKEADRVGDPLLSDTANRLRRLQKVDAFKAQQESTRAARTEQYRQRLRAEMAAHAEQLTIENDQLGRMSTTTPPSAPPAPPTPEGNKDKRPEK